MRYISTAEMAEIVRSPGAKLIDVNAPESYNGWKSSGEGRGGHIQNARSLPARWSSYIDWMDIVQAKGITPGDRLIVYGRDRREAEKVASFFERAGHKDVRVYAGFGDEWIPDPDLPVERLERYRHLVSASWLKGLLDTGGADECGNAQYRVCHAHYRNREDYLKGHIPGAVDIDTNALESQETWNRRSPGELARALEGVGITCDTTVILYGRFSFPKNDDPFPGSSAGHLAAFRCAFIMMYAGVRDVRILNGGMQSWQDAGYPVETADAGKRPVAGFGETVPVNGHLAIDTDGAKEFLSSAGKNLVSVRSWREYIGEVSGYNYIAKKGRIPGAVFGNCGTDAYHMENYRNPDHTTREYGEIEKLWRAAGVTPEKHNAFYCGTGWRASEAFFNAWLMGWSNIAVYDGGWFEWSSDGANAYETGLPHR